jgi:hypothetical protein
MFLCAKKKAGWYGRSPMLLISSTKLLDPHNELSAGCGPRQSLPYSQNVDNTFFLLPVTNAPTNHNLTSVTRNRIMSNECNRSRMISGSNEPGK